MRIERELDVALADDAEVTRGLIAIDRSILAS
jgi:hypothetical protein